MLPEVFLKLFYSPILMVSSKESSSLRLVYEKQPLKDKKEDELSSLLPDEHESEAETFLTVLGGGLR
jgi:hypothetical protein